MDRDIVLTTPLQTRSEMKAQLIHATEPSAQEKLTLSDNGEISHNFLLPEISSSYYQLSNN
jgi:hypothetical protein